MSFYISRPSNFKGFCLVRKRKTDKRKTLLCYEDFERITGYFIPKGSGAFFNITKVRKNTKYSRCGSEHCGGKYHYYCGSQHCCWGGAGKRAELCPMNNKRSKNV